MAHSPEKKAEAVYDIVNGMTWDDATTKHGVSKSTLKAWIDAAKTEPKSNSVQPKTELLPIGAQAREDRFDAAFKGFLIATVNMLRSIAETCSDPEFIRAKPEGVNDLAVTVFDRAERIMAVVRDQARASEAEAPAAVR